MTSGRAPRSGHHLFWSTGRGKLLHYRASGRNVDLPATRDISIWSLRRRFPALVQWLLLERALRTGFHSQRISTLALAALQALAAHRSGEGAGSRLPLEWRRPLFGILMLGPQRGLAHMARQLPALGGILTPNYRTILSLLATTFDDTADLTLLTCKPNVYLWLPPGSENSTRVLVCFCTSSNSLNAPLPVAHAALATRGIPICYVFNRRNYYAYRGLPGLDTEQSGRVINRLLDRLGFSERFGLGTSLGGYTVCRYASAIGLRRVLNFSGWPDKGGAFYTDIDCMSKALGAFPKEQVLTVLSATDPNDQSIRRSYDDGPFVTPRVFLETPTHGSLLAAIIEGRLDGLLDWLLEESPAEQRGS